MPYARIFVGNAVMGSRSGLLSCGSIGIFGAHCRYRRIRGERCRRPTGLYSKPGGMIGSGHNRADRACNAAPVVGERGAERQVDDDAPNRRFDPGAQLQQA